MTLETLTLEDALEEQEDFLKLIAKGNLESFNYTKLAEELAELSEVVLKMNNKGVDKRPNKQLFIEEAGDVMIRIFIAGFMLFPEEEELPTKLQERMDFKVGRMVQNVIAKKYLNQV